MTGKVDVFAGLTSVNTGRVSPPGPFYSGWMCAACLLGLHDNCAGDYRVCFCPVCWEQEDEDQEPAEATFDGSLTSAGKAATIVSSPGIPR